MRNIPLVLAAMLVFLSFPIGAYVGAIPALIVAYTGAIYAYLDTRYRGF